MADTELGEFYGAATHARSSGTGLIGLAGAATSLALVIGLGVWGYKLMMRDINGVPVIKALQGPMRVQPDDPGGERMAFQGLTVNEVAARGEAGDIPEELVLAPEPAALLDHDLPKALLSDGPVPDYSNAADEAVAAVLEEVPEGEGDAAEVEQVAFNPDEVIPAKVPGVKRSLIPPARPPGIHPVSAKPAAAPEAPAAVVEIDADSLPVGSRLVQLGAFESVDEAREAWGAIAERFSEVMAGKQRVIQQATSNGKAFYRLRVAGFDDLADARRFCATLTSDKTKPLCVPVATR